MVQNNCCLCTKNSDNYKSLKDSNDQWNEVHNLVIKYFDATFLRLNSKIGLSVCACLDCWHTMNAFNEFQQSILEAQKKLLESCVKTEENYKNSKNTYFEIREVEEILKEKECQSELEKNDDDKKPFIHPELEIMDILNDSNEEKSSKMHDSSENEGETVWDDDGQDNELNKNPKRNADNDDNNKLTELECCVCNKQYPSYSQLQQHFREDHPQEEFYVYCCQRKLNTRNKIIQHMRFHSNPNAYKCDLCNRSFSRPSTLKHHNSNFHADPNNHSKNYKSDNKRKPQYIDKLISKIMPELRCALCQETRPTYTQLKDHFRREHPTVQCHISCCGQQLKRRTTIERHINDHLDSYDCKICEKTFYCRKGLMIHMRIHDRNPSRSNNKTIRKVASKKVAKTKAINDVTDNNIENNTLATSKIANNNTSNNTIASINIAKNTIANNISANNTYVENNCTENKSNGNSNFTNNSFASNDAKNNTVSNIPAPKDYFIAQLKPELDCVTCSDKFSTYTLLQQHFQQQHPNDEFYIMCCNHKLKDRYRLKEHLLIHYNPNSFISEDVGKLSDSSRKTTKQLDAIIAEWQPNLQCPLCEITYPNFRQLKEHFRDKHPQDECHIQCCKRKLISRERIFNHISLHKTLNE